MNEVTKIHLGRTAFAISADAHRELRSYLDAIRRHVSDGDVVNEIEMRMAELLNERGVQGEQVILPADVDYLKEQLGDPKDFAEDDEQPADTPPDSKRLFRDTDHAMFAGVAAGLGNYFGVDTLLIRLLFVIGTFAGGWGILIYLVLWLLVPEAKTPSDRLRMAGKPVNVETLKRVVEDADVKGVTQRAGNAVTHTINSAFYVLLKIVGVGFVAFGTALLLALASGTTYVLLNRHNLRPQDVVFPVGGKEFALVYLGAAIIGLVAVFIVLLGLAMFRRKWPVHAWVSGVLVGLALIGLSVGGALAADIVPQVRDRYNARVHTTQRDVAAFSSVNLDEVGNNVSDIEFNESDTYSVSFRYFDNANPNTIKTTVRNGVLYVDSRGFDNQRHCKGLCIPGDYQMTVIINSPNPDPGQVDNGMPALPEKPVLQ